MARTAAPPRPDPARVAEIARSLTGDPRPSRLRALIGRMLRWLINGAFDEDDWLDRRAAARLQDAPPDGLIEVPGMLRRTGFPPSGTAARDPGIGSTAARRRVPR